MLNILNISKLGLLFINYIICIVTCRSIGILQNVSGVVLVGLSVGLLCASVVLSYRYINVNVMYNAIYAIIILMLVCSKSIKISDMMLFALCTTVVIIAIFCWYLDVYVSKMKKIVTKGGSVNEVEGVYKKQVLNLLVVMTLAWAVLMVLYYILQGISAKVITYLYSINTIFSIPAVIGFVIIMLISIFVFVVYMLV